MLTRTAAKVCSDRMAFAAGDPGGQDTLTFPDMEHAACSRVGNTLCSCMHVISRKALREAVQRLPPAQRSAAEKAYSTWYKVASEAKWNSFSEVKLTFNTADNVGGKLVFDIGGNKHRLVALPAYRSKRIYVLFAGSHKEYDALDVTNM